MFTRKNGTGPIAVVEDRLRFVWNDCVKYFIRIDFTHAYGDEAGWQAYSEYLHHGLFAIRRRLGLQRFAELTDTLDRALAGNYPAATLGGHMAWLVPL